MSDGGAAALIVVFLLLGIGSLAVWVWALVDAVRVPDDSMFKSGTKLVWILVIVLAGVIGAIIYLVVGRPDPRARVERPSSFGLPPPPPGSVG